MKYFNAKKRWQRGKIGNLPIRRSSVFKFPSLKRKISV